MVRTYLNVTNICGATVELPQEVADSRARAVSTEALCFISNACGRS